MKTILKLFLLFIISSSCNKVNLRNGEASLTGNWQVEKVIYGEANRNEFGGIGFEALNEAEGALGTFSFEDQSVSYEYLLGDSLLTGQGDWHLTRFRQQEGFFKVERYYLEIDGVRYNCEFGDETRDAEKNATQVRLVFEAEEMGPFILQILELQKE